MHALPVGEHDEIIIPRYKRTGDLVFPGELTVSITEMCLGGTTIEGQAIHFFRKRIAINTAGDWILERSDVPQDRAWNGISGVIGYGWNEPEFAGDIGCASRLSIRQYRLDSKGIRCTICAFNCIGYVQYLGGA